MANPAETLRQSAVDIGEKLRKARESKAITIEQAQRQTRIHSTVISRLEEGSCDDMLAPNYVKSFLKEYANFLGLDSNQLVSAYVAGHPELDKKTARLSRLETRPQEEGPGVLGILARIVPLIAAVVIVPLLFKMTFDFFRHPKMPKTAAPSKAAAGFDKKSALSSSDITIRRIPKSTPLLLTIRVKRPVMIQVKRDGVLLFKRVLQKGSVESLTARDSISIFVAKAESIDLTLNGTNLGSPGKGTIKNLEIMRSGIRIK